MTRDWRGAWRGLGLRVEASDDWTTKAPTLHVGSADGRLEWLHFECSPETPSVRVSPSGGTSGADDEVRPLDERRDPIEEAFASLARGPSGLLKRFGLAIELAGGRADEPRPTDAATLRDAERALRHRSAVLDELDAVSLRERRSEKWHTYPPDVLPVWVAEMDFPVAAPVEDVVRRFLDRSDFGYPIGLRDTGLPEVFAERMEERFGWRVDPARVEILSEVVQGMYVALEAFSRPGDGAIVQTPIYPPFLHSVRDTGRRLVDNRMRFEDGEMHFDLDGLDALREAGARVFLFCNPHNPSGRVYAHEELERVAAFVVRNDLVVVSDEIHADLVFDDRPHVPLASLGDEIARRTVTLTSASKAFNIPGLRTAIAHFGSADLQEPFNTVIHRHVRGGLGLLGLYASIAAWRHGQPWLDEVVPYLAGNRGFVAEALRERIPEIGFVHPEATYLAWLDARAVRFEGKARSPAAAFLREGRVALTDGRVFGEGWEGFARLNLGTSRAILAEAIDRMAKALGR